MTKQHSKIKNPIVNVKNCLNEVFPAFNSLNKKLSSGFCLVDNFSDHFPFHSANQQDTDTQATH